MTISTIIGVRPMSFTGKDGNTISGVNIFVTSPLPDFGNNPGRGLMAEKLFLSDNRVVSCVQDCGVKSPLDLVGKSIYIYYNRFGKVDSILSAD